MRKLNHRFRGKDRPTDVLSFPLHESLREIRRSEAPLLGDIVVNLHAAKRQAADYGVTLPAEVRRLLIHGFLHLLGFDHEQGPAQARRMTRKERELRRVLAAMD
jgi:probable rRNA maturation factor